MSEEEAPVEASQFLKNINPMVLVSVAAGAVLVALFALVSLILLLSLSSDMTRLEDQIRKAGKVAKAMEQEMVQLRTLLAPVAAAKQAEIAAATPPPPRPSYIDAADPARDCVVRPGDKGGISNCLKQ